MKNNVIAFTDCQVDLDTLWSKDELLEKLSENKGAHTYSMLSELCDAHPCRHTIYWPYPITDGVHNGTYFVLCKEGILSLPYNDIYADSFFLLDLPAYAASDAPYGRNEHKIFVLSEATLIETAEEMQCFIDDWMQRSYELITAMTCMKAYLQQRGGNEQ